MTDLKIDQATNARNIDDLLESFAGPPRSDRKQEIYLRSQLEKPKPTEDAERYQQMVQDYERLRARNWTNKMKLFIQTFGPDPFKSDSDLSAEFVAKKNLHRMLCIIHDESSLVAKRLCRKSAELHFAYNDVVRAGEHIWENAKQEVAIAEVRLNQQSTTSSGVAEAAQVRDDLAKARLVQDSLQGIGLVEKAVHCANAWWMENVSPENERHLVSATDALMSHCYAKLHEKQGAQIFDNRVNMFVSLVTAVYGKAVAAQWEATMKSTVYRKLNDLGDPQHKSDKLALQYCTTTAVMEAAEAVDAQREVTNSSSDEFSSDEIVRESKRRKQEY
eukprot:CAMPEP_0197315108 /NCGR_PEP_ID=MMETSP0891-20130614/36744_1 /TAXON_ID=44058 ORGANISM="Aureoumbra lagunensis, Strain CCMP1510" /NCGR_SAMPLE_ID=MMETSP0891 /ASSEMBLY_ACC=CAM_ASM_000534 /LENGTH=331 /DNA_ID=CAMNT_0042803897 /DNA_START=39 /DNA_END=1034 /DNA_ORIENTATION=-